MSSRVSSRHCCVQTITAKFKEDLVKLDDDANAYDSWVIGENPRSALAVILLTDQFSRNIFRGTAASFAYDAIARDISLKLIGLSAPVMRVCVSVCVCIFGAAHLSLSLSLS